MRLRSINGNAPSQELDRVLRAVVMDAMIAEAPLLDLLEFYVSTGETDKIYPKSGTKMGQFRELNASVTPKTTEIGAPIDVAWKILSDSVATDRALIDRGIVVEDEHLRSLTEASKALGRYFTDKFIAGSGSGAEVKGIRSQITGAQDIVYGGTNGGIVPFGDTDAHKADQLKFLEQLDKIIYAMNPDLLMLNADMIARMETIAKQWLTVTNIKDAFGKTQRIIDYKGVQMLNAGYKQDETSLVIPNTETAGTSSDCTSIYILKFGEKTDVTCKTTKSGLKVVHNSKDKNFVTTDVELQYDQAVVKAKSAARLRGIRLSA